MEPFQVYSQFDVEPVQGEGSWFRDADGTRYLDFYGGHAVISIGHNHPHLVNQLQEQAGKLGYYSSAAKNSLQHQLAKRLGVISGYEDYSLFMCNSGAEANENALKLASFHNNRTKLVAFKKGFHGRTSGAVSITDHADIQAPVNRTGEVEFLPLNDFNALEQLSPSKDVCAVILEGIQGIGGVNIPDSAFLQKLKDFCDHSGAVLILDEIQSGYGRSGKFFAHQYAGIRPDLITVAKGMGNGFPVGGVLISPKFEAKAGMLGTTFGGNHLACAAGLAVLDVLEEENAIENARTIGAYLTDNIAGSHTAIREVRGLGLMIGIEFDFAADPLREKLLYDHHVFTGSSSDKNTLRLLPPLTVSQDEADLFLESLAQVLQSYG
ncbi:MAG: aminotransferase class III-fold pyridoxal phosphate-dependent enzyme [Candidatus Marinimicrobia bacterium]|nr:aminotransferase class III-fold pyridoxal phosphate-dependent enzyme [Candidatus Neomarinimicrobiota bacterium]MCF7829486.1 aminotransferase class III-fold pyridoxal phosphate-dependent enzyme [Candidatus Neomarinimicrobiota bacterium]MCF7880116.1 aminotransferase class III-fold pyridoxal phosphate-dependent enzyme [Candidatus Neomarinimicrobiota bacterium]